MSLPKKKNQMNIIKVTDQQLEYLQNIVMEAYALEVPEQKDWDIQTFDNMVDAVCGARAEYLWQLKNWSESMSRIITNILDFIQLM